MGTGTVPWPFPRAAPARPRSCCSAPQPVSKARKTWAKRWRDVYIGTRANLVGTRQLGGSSYCQFGYHGTQGEFAVELPAEACYLIDTDSTVENLALHVAGRLAAEQPGSRYRVRAFEGVDKGAIAEA